MQTERLVYQIKIEGHIRLDWINQDRSCCIEHTEEGLTILTCELPDQTALHGILTRIRDLGVSLIEVIRVNTKN